MVAIMHVCGGLTIIDVFGITKEQFETFMPAFSEVRYVPPDTHLGIIQLGERYELHLGVHCPLDTVFESVVDKAVKAARDEDFISSFPPEEVLP